MLHKSTTNFLSAVIITKNEAEIVALCLDSLQGVADEIVVADSFSTDRTHEICTSYPNVKFHEVEWQGYAATKNYANSLASHDWILSMDADEALSEELRASILQLKEQGHSCYYSFARLTNYCGQWIRHGGWYPDVKFRLFDRRNTRWEGEYVHERLLTDADTKPQLLKGDCLHYSYRSIAQHVAQVNRFSSLAAEEKAAKGKKAGIMKMLFSPWFFFIKMYLLKQGFRDGRYGFIIAVISACSRFLRYAKLYELNRRG